jgi:hypothetical protein
LLIKNRKSAYRTITDIPENFEQKYCKISSKIINFRTSVLFGTKAMLQLEEEELNLLSLKSYIDSRDDDIKNYVFSKFSYYSFVDGDKLLLKEVYPFFFFKFISLRSEFYVKFKLYKGEIIQQRKNNIYFGRKNDSLEYYDFNGFSDSDLLLNILGSVDSSNHRNELVSRRQLLQKTAEPFIKKIVSITVSNNSLVICC